MIRFKISLIFILFHSFTCAQVFLDNTRALDELNEEGGAEAYPWLSPDGLTLYYTKGDWGKTRIYKSTRPNISSRFTAGLLCTQFAAGSYSLWLTNDMSSGVYCNYDIVLNRYGLYKINMSSQASSLLDIGTPVNSNFSNNFITNPSYNSNLDFYLVVNSTKGNTVDLLRYNDSGVYNSIANPASVTKYISGVIGGQLSKTPSTFEISSESRSNNYSVGKASISGLSQNYVANPNINFFEVQRAATTNQDNTFNIQSTANSDRSILVFVKNDNNEWNQNDLYISSNSTPGQTFREEMFYNPEETIIKNVPELNTYDMVTYYPNPAKEGFFVTLITDEMSTKLDFDMLDMTGNNVLSKHDLNTKTFYLDVGIIHDGLYLCILNVNGKKSYNKIVINK